MATAKRKRATTRKRTKAPPLPPSEWNGHDLGWSTAAEVFDGLNGLASAARVDGGHLGRAVADVIDALAWSLNRRDLALVRKLGPSARAWLAKNRPLLGDVERDRLADEKRMTLTTENDAYAYAVERIDRVLSRAPKRDAPSLAKSVATFLRVPLPPLRPQHVEELARRIAEWRVRCRTFDAQAVVNAAVLLAGLSKSRKQALDSWLRQRGKRDDDRKRVEST